MNCELWEGKIALYVAGDLETPEANLLHRHLADCADCRELLATFQTSGRMLQELKAETIDVSRVHVRVMDRVRELEANRSWADRLVVLLWGGFRWRYAVLGCVAVLIAWSGVQMIPRESVPVPLVAVRIPSAPMPAIIAPQMARVTHRAVRPKRRVISVAADTVVQLQTDDPNVVIYWLIESKGDR